MSLARAISRGRALKARLAVNGMKKASRSFGTAVTMVLRALGHVLSRALWSITASAIASLGCDAVSSSRLHPPYGGRFAIMTGREVVIEMPRGHYVAHFRWAGRSGPRMMWERACSALQRLLAA